MLGPDHATEDDHRFMREALAAAREAATWTDVPVGAVVVVGGEVVGRSGNEQERVLDPSAHAEVLALRRAADRLGTRWLTEATVYSTLEPCPMCAGALLAARVRRLVYGAADPKAGAAGSLYNLCEDPRLNHRVEVVWGVEEEAAAALLRDFFEGRRGDRA